MGGEAKEALGGRRRQEREGGSGQENVEGRSRVVDEGRSNGRRERWRRISGREDGEGMDKGEGDGKGKEG